MKTEKRVAGPGVFNPSRPDSAAKKGPVGKAEIRAELIELVRALENSQDGLVIQNISREGFMGVRLDELKHIVILLSRLLLSRKEAS